LRWARKWSGKFGPAELGWAGSRLREAKAKSIALQDAEVVEKQS
jgi:hypothetical protein